MSGDGEILSIPAGFRPPRKRRESRGVSKGPPHHCVLGWGGSSPGCTPPTPASPTASALTAPNPLRQPQGWQRRIKIIGKNFFFLGGLQHRTPAWMGIDAGVGYPPPSEDKGLGGGGGCAAAPQLGVWVGGETKEGEKKRGGPSWTCPPSPNPPQPCPGEGDAAAGRMLPSPTSSSSSEHPDKEPPPPPPRRSSSLCRHATRGPAPPPGEGGRRAGKPTDPPGKLTQASQTPGKSHFIYEMLTGSHTKYAGTRRGGGSTDC